MTEEQQEDKNKRIRPRERARGQKNLLMSTQHNELVLETFVTKTWVDIVVTY